MRVLNRRLSRLGPVPLARIRAKTVRTARGVLEQLRFRALPNRLTTTCQKSLTSLPLLRLPFEPETTMNKTAIPRHFHRNGVAGLGFYVSLDNGMLTVSFSLGDQPERPVTVPLSTFAILMETKPGRKVELSRGGGWIKLRGVQQDLNNHVSFYAMDSDDGPMIALYDGSMPEIPCAVFNWDKIKAGNVDFGSNSWRGDVFWDAIKRALAMGKL